MNKRRRFKAKRRRYERKHPKPPKLKFHRLAFSILFVPFVWHGPARG